MKNTARKQTEFTRVKDEKKPPAASTADSYQQCMTQVESLTRELHKLLINHENILEREGIRHEVETLARWLETYRHGLSAAHKISENSTYWLFDFRNKLRLAAQELQRLEDEGGSVAASGKQAKEPDELLKAVGRIDEILPSIQHLFCEGTESKDAHCLT